MKTIICPFRKRTEVDQDGAMLEYFMECDKEKCAFCNVESELLPQRRPFEKRETQHTYYCYHPQRIRLKRISENHFVYTEIEIGKEYIE